MGCAIELKDNYLEVMGGDFGQFTFSRGGHS